MKCPICNEEIDKLINIISGTMEYHLSLGIQGDIQWETCNFEPDDDMDEYTCPECCAVLFNKESKAVAFLRGE